MRRLAMIGGALLVLIVAGVVILYLSLGSLIRSGVETYGPRVTKSKVRLGGVSVSPFSGKAQLSDLVVGNPEGFEAPSAFKLGALRMSLDVGSLRSDTVVIHEIIVTAPEITYELGPGGSNLKVLQKNVKEFTGAGKGGAGTPKAAEDGTKVVIDRLRVEKPKLHVSAAALRGETLTLALPDIELKDIGKEGQGASFAEVVDLIMKEVNRDTAKAVAGVDLKGLTEKARREAEKALEKEVEGAAPGMGEKLKGLFGK